MRGRVRCLISVLCGHSGCFCISFSLVYICICISFVFISVLVFDMMNRMKGWIISPVGNVVVGDVRVWALQQKGLMSGCPRRVNTSKNDHLGDFSNFYPIEKKGKVLGKNCCFAPHVIGGRRNHFHPVETWKIMIWVGFFFWLFIH